MSVRQLLEPAQRRHWILAAAALAAAVVGLLAAAVVGLLAAASAGTQQGADRARPILTAGRQVSVSGACRGQNTEVQQAVDASRGYAYETWIGCGGIGFARSTDRERSFQRPIRLSRSLGFTEFTDDPAIALAPSGAVYVSFIAERAGRSFPVLTRSLDHGATFTQSTSLMPPHRHDFADRTFLAVGPHGTVYLTWDYGRNEASVKDVCAEHGTCSFTSGELNVVIQKSTDGGRTFGPISHVSPGFPASGADSGPVLVERNGRVDVLYQGYRVTDRASMRLGRAHTFFTASTDQGLTWSAPLEVGRGAGSMSTAEWWIDGDIAIDQAGDLFATWDTQAPAGARAGSDTGWLSYSTDHGRHFSAPVAVTPDHRDVPHIVEVASVAPGLALLAWLSDSDRRGYAAYARAFMIGRGWISPAIRVSRAFGTRTVSPGDTFGVSRISFDRILLTFASAAAPHPNRSRIFAVPVTVRVP